MEDTLKMCNTKEKQNREQTSSLSRNYGHAILSSSTVAQSLQKVLTAGISQAMLMDLSAAVCYVYQNPMCMLERESEHRNELK